MRQLLQRTSGLYEYLTDRRIFRPHLRAEAARLDRAGLRATTFDTQPAIDGRHMHGYFRLSAPRLALVLMSIGGLVFAAGHTRRTGPIGMALFLAGVAWLELRSSPAEFQGGRGPGL